MATKLVTRLDTRQYVAMQRTLATFGFDYSFILFIYVFSVNYNNHAEGGAKACMH
jgi:hypothetical protein